MQTKLPVGILGATGIVGQRFVQMLEHHPWFEVAWLAASDRSEGKSYAEAARWRMKTALPQRVAEMRVSPAKRGRVSGSSFSRHSWQCDPLHCQRRRKDGGGNAKAARPAQWLGRDPRRLCHERTMQPGGSGRWAHRIGFCEAEKESATCGNH